MKVACLRFVLFVLFMLFMLFVLFMRVKSSCKKRKVKRFKITLIPSFTILFIMTQITRLQTPDYMRHFHIFDKTDSFLKMLKKFLTSKKVDYIFEEPLNLLIIVVFTLVIIFFLVLWIPGANREKLKKLFDLNSRPQIPEIHRIHLLNSYQQFHRWNWFFLTEDNICFISDCKNSFICNLKKLINEQIIMFYSTSNTLCSSEESVHIKHFKGTLTDIWKMVLRKVLLMW